MRRDSNRLGQGAPNPANCFGSDLLSFDGACFTMQLGCSDRGLPALLPGLLQALGAQKGGRQLGAEGAAASSSHGSGSVRAAAAPHARGAAAAAGGVTVSDVSMVAQAVAACGCEGIRQLGPLLEQLAASAAGTLAALPEDNLRIGSGQTMNAAWLIRDAVRHLPLAILPEAAPQRALVALAQVLRTLKQRTQGDAQYIDKTMQLLAGTILLLAADEELQPRCVPGWVWFKKRTPGAAQPPCTLDLAGLAALHGRGYVPPAGPVLTVLVSNAVSERFGSRRWMDHSNRMADVAALARTGLTEAAVGELLDGRAWQLAEDTGAGELWPLRRLRMCGNPRCGNLGGASEAGLEPKRCAACRVVRYCCAACQRQHWPQHNADCLRWRLVATTTALDEE